MAQKKHWETIKIYIKEYGLYLQGTDASDSQ